MVDILGGLPEGELPDIIPDLEIPIVEGVTNAAQNVVGELKMIPVLSTDIAAWGYKPTTFQLQIEFTNGRVYLYDNISPLEFGALMNAPSKGSAFWALVRRNPVAHPFVRLV